MQKLTTKTLVTERKFVPLHLQKGHHVDSACSDIID